ADVIRQTFPDILGLPVTHVSTVNNRRLQLTMARDIEQYKLCIDNLNFVNPGTDATSSNRLELEIEALNDAALGRLDELRTSLRRIFPELNYSDRTKYESSLDYIDKGEPDLTPALAGDAQRADDSLKGEAQRAEDLSTGDARRTNDHADSLRLR